jgi:hypothetical protein
MEQNQLLNTSIPLWGIITFGLTAIGVAIWNGIKLYFNDKRMTIKSIEQDNSLIKLEGRLDIIKTQFHNELESHKKETEREFSRINTKLDTQNTTLTEVKTYVKLLVEDKIKKNGNS